jgi:hypothetical protein
MDTKATNDTAIVGLENDIRDMKYGTISGVVVRDGCFQPDATPRKRYTRKPRTGAKQDALSASATLYDSLQDFRRDIEELRGDWTVTIKVANGLPQSWERERIGSS